MWPMPALDRVVELGLGLVVAVHVEARGVVAAGEGEVELAAGGHVGGEALVGEQPVDRGARERLARVDHLEVLGAGAERLEERARASAHVVLRVDVRGGAELARELDHVAAADLEPAALVQSRAQGIHVRDRQRRTSDGDYEGAMRHPTPAPPQLGEHDGLAYALFLPEREPERGSARPARGGLREGEPLRLRARLPRRGDGGAGLRRPRARPLGRRLRARRDRRRAGDARAAARARAGAGAARVEHGRLPGDPRGGARTLHPVRRGRDLPRLRGAAPARPSRRAADRLRVRRRRLRAAGCARATCTRRPAGLGPATALLLLHARGDEQVPYTVSEQLHEAAREPKRLLLLPGGHHRSIQHDLELQAESRRFIRKDDRLFPQGRQSPDGTPEGPTEARAATPPCPPRSDPRGRARRRGHQPVSVTVSPSVGRHPADRSANGPGHVLDVLRRPDRSRPRCRAARRVSVVGFRGSRVPPPDEPSPPLLPPWPPPPWPPPSPPPPHLVAAAARAGPGSAVAGAGPLRVGRPSRPAAPPPPSPSRPRSPRSRAPERAPERASEADTVFDSCWTTTRSRPSASAAAGKAVERHDRATDCRGAARTSRSGPRSCRGPRYTPWTSSRKWATRCLPVNR